MIAGLALRWVGISLVLGGALQAGTFIRTRLRTPSRRARRTAPLLRRLAALYDCTRGGVRLATKLRAAAIEMTPASFRLAAVLVFIPLVVVMVEATGSTAAGLGVASIAVRVGTAVILRVRRENRDRRVEAFAEGLSRHLATELASGASAEEALLSARATPGGRCPPGSELLDRTLGRSRSGDPVARALRHAAGEERPGRGEVSLRRLATVLDLAVAGGAGTAAVSHLGDGIAASRQARAEAASAMAEARLAAVAVPILAAGMGMVLAITSPAVAAGALTFPIAPLVLAAGMVAVAGTLLVRRITRA